MPKLKTPEYMRRAVAKYQAKFDRVNINLPRGLKEQIKEATGESLSACVIRLLMQELENAGHPYQAPADDTENG